LHIIIFHIDSGFSFFYESSNMVTLRVVVSSFLVLSLFSAMVFWSAGDIRWRRGQLYVSLLVMYTIFVESTPRLWSSGLESEKAQSHGMLSGQSSLVLCFSLFTL